MVFQGLRRLISQGGQVGAIPLLLGVGLQFALIPLAESMAIAQLIPDSAPDRALGTTVEQSTPELDRVTGGARQGANLFHSFSEFNINQGQQVYFANPVGVENILTRVTGQNVSSILGILGVEGGANLFLLNPNGILFGPNAQLDIRGSFVASTASSFQFADGTEFSATNPQAPPLLTINLTPGLQYGSIQPDSAIANRGTLVTGQDLTLVSAGLDLQGQLQAGRDLTLQAQNYVQIQDTATAPFIAVAGNHVLVQGDQFISISAFNHVSSGFWSGSDLTLRAYNPVVGDAYFYAGRNFKIEQFVDFPGNFFNFNNPVILAAGNVSLGDYQGSSLHILAGGNVVLGSATIYSTGETTTTINPNNTKPFNATKTFADLATVELTDYQPIYNSDGSVQNVVPVRAPITIDGSSQATLDVRAGVNWNQLGGLPTRPLSLETAPPAPESVGVPERADITVTGNIRVDQPSGLVLLTNQFYPNELQGTVAAQGINTSTNISEANGGDIRLYGRQDVVLGSLYSFTESGASSYSNEGNAGNGGNIFLSSHLGDVFLLYSPLYSTSFSAFGNAGKGGTISLASYSGDILAIGSSSSLVSYGNFETGTAVSGGNISFTTNSGDVLLIESSFSLSTGTAGNGGNASLTTNSGEILIVDSYLSASGESFSGNAGNGGNISFTTNSGNISLENTNSHTDSLSFGGDTGNGGNISFTTNSGDISLKKSFLLSESSSPGNTGKGGDISFITNSGNISLSNSGSASNSESGLGTAGSGGSIFLSSNLGDISLSNWRLTSTSSSDKGIAGNGGNISLTTNFGDISLSNTRSSSYSFSTSGTVGKGGDISLSAYSGNIIGSASSLSSFAISPDSSRSSGDGGNVSLTAKNQIGNLEIFTQSLSASAGAVKITGTGDLTLTDLEISTSKTVSLINPFTSEIITFTPGEKGRSGEVTITGSGNLTFDNILIQSTTQGIDPAGNVQISSPGLVTFNNSQILSNTSSTGQAGSIGITAGQGIILTNGSQLSARTSNVGTAGDITLNAPILTVAGDAQVLAETEGSGQGGSILVNAPTAVNLTRVQDFFPVLSVEARGAGQAGDIVINTPSLTLADLARITATATATATNPAGGGSITLNASNLYLAGIVGVFAETQGQAPAGTLRLNPYNNHLDLSVTLTPSSRISASTSGNGNGGDLILAAPRSIVLSGPGQLAVEASSTGNAGNIDVATQELTLTNGVELSASTSNQGAAGGITIAAEILNLNQGARVSTNTTGSGQAGNITVKVKDRVALTDSNTGLSASTSGGQGGAIAINTHQLQISNGASLNATTTSDNPGGNIRVTAHSFDATTGGQLRTTTSGGGRAGDITVQASDWVRLTDPTTGLYAETTAAGQGGAITVNSDRVQISNAATLNATANAEGEGGNITVNANRLTVENRGQLRTTTSGSGQAGNIIFNLTDTLTLSGRGTGLFADTETGSTGNGGSIFIAPPTVLIKDGAGIAVGSRGTGQGGNIQLQTSRLTLDNQSFITAETASTQGGNITLTAQDILLMRRNSLISATAGTAQAGGNGGNITITIPKGFIIAVPQENSDITANAFTGQGGNVQITAQGIFGLQFQPQLTPFSDITASSQFGVNGSVTLNTPNVDPSRGLVALPTGLVDGASLISQECAAQRNPETASSFYITGRGGLPYRPGDLPTSQFSTGTVRPAIAATAATASSPQASNATNSAPRIIEAAYWARDASGNVSLVATAAHAPALKVLECSPTP